MPPTQFKFKLPRLYKAATKIVKTVKEEGSDVAALVSEYKKKTNINALSALVQRVLESEKLVNQIIENTGILKENRSDPWLYRVLITELLLGKKRLPVGCNPIQTVLAFGPKLTIELKKLRRDKRAGQSIEDSSSDGSDEAVSEEEEEPPQKKRNRVSKEEPELQAPPQKKRHRVSKEEPELQAPPQKKRNRVSNEEPELQTPPQKKRNRVSKKEPESPEEEESKDLTTPKKHHDSDEESTTEAKKPEDYISVKPSAVQAKRGRNLMEPHTKKFVSPKQQNLRKFKQFAKRSHSQTPRGNKFKKDKPRYFEVPSSV